MRPLSVVQLASQAVMFLSVVALLIALALSLRFPSRILPWLAPAYLAAQSLFVIIGWLGLQRDNIESRTYLFFFGVGFFITLGFAIAFAVRLAFVHPKALGIWLICTALSFGSLLSAVVYLELRKTYGIHPIPPQCQIAMLQGSVLVFCAASSLVALFTELAPELRYAVIAFGTFWMTLGIFALSYALGIIRNRPVFLHLNDFLTAFLAIVAFSWLAFQWGRLQAEPSRQAVPTSVQELVPAEK